MLSDLEEQRELQGSLLSRYESPLLEAAAAKVIEVAMRELIETRYLYQKVTVDLDPVEKLLKEHLTKEPLPGIRSITGGQLAARSSGHSDRIRALRAEIEKRPWYLATRHMGDNPGNRPSRTAYVPTLPLGASADQMPIVFYLPAVQIVCGGACKQLTVFSAHVSSSRFCVEDVYPRHGGRGIEQVLHPTYRCEVCRTKTYSILVHRSGLRLQLCGFAPRREPLPSRLVPEPLVAVLSDAEQAVAENDVFAGFYHLRILLEHYLKQRLGIPLEDQIRGEELINRHYEMLPVAWRSVLPPISDGYAALSKNLHGRRGKVEDFRKFRNQICDHIEMLAMMDRQGSLPH